MRRIYLDHNATAPQHPEVTRAMQLLLGEGYGNPSSVHWFGRRARAALEAARARVAELVGGAPPDIVLTGGATEANNLAVRGVLAASGRRHLVVSAVEHPSVSAVAGWLRRQGIEVTTVPVDGRGRVDPDAVGRALRPETGLVSIMLANHETGVLQPVAEVAARARGAGVPVHTDAVQAAGRVEVDVQALGVDLLTLSGHKMGGPPGVGALWVRRGLSIVPLLQGGGQEGNRRSGTENLPGAVGLGEAARVALQSAIDNARIRRLRDRLETELLERWPGARAHGAGAARLPNTASIGFPGLDGEAAVMRLDLEGVAVSLGSACTAGAMRPSPVLAAMGVPDALARGSLRFSLGPGTGADEIDRAIRVFEGTLSPARPGAGRAREAG